MLPFKTISKYTPAKPDVQDAVITHIRPIVLSFGVAVRDLASPVVGEVWERATKRNNVRRENQRWGVIFLDA